MLLLQVHARRLLYSTRPSICSTRLSWLRKLHHTSGYRLDISSGVQAGPTFKEKPGLKLRGYQEDCIKSVLDALQDGKRQVGVSLATGSGKTVIFTELVDRVLSPTVEATQCLILAHRRELVEQATRHCTSRYPDKTVEVDMADIHASGYADITIASVMSLNSGDRLNKYDPKRFKLILVDEAHHIVAKGYLDILEHFGLQSEAAMATPALVGVSATLSRFDGLALNKAIKHIVYHKDYVEMIDEEWLSNIIFTTVKTNVDLTKTKKAASGDFLSSSLSKAVNTPQVNLVTVRSWLTKAAERKSTIVFCVDVSHVEHLAATFRNHGIDARYVTGKTPQSARANMLDAFRNQEFPVLLNCGVFTEGTDIPNIDCVLLARPTRSRNLLIQMIGRGMRLCSGKKNCHIIDMVAALDSGIIATPTLFGLDPSEIYNNITREDAEAIRACKSENLATTHDIKSESTVQDASIRSVRFSDYDSVDELLGDSSAEKSIRAISAHAWVHVGEDRYVLQNSDGSYLTLETLVFAEVGSAQHTVKYTQKLKASTSPFARPRLLVTSQTFEGAVRGADTFAAEHFPRNIISLRLPASSNWRLREASQAQLDFLNKYRVSDHQLEVSEVTKGQAGDMITKIKFGAKGRVKKAQQIKRKAAQVKEKIHALRRREDVKVGVL